MTIFIIGAVVGVICYALGAINEAGIQKRRRVEDIGFVMRENELLHKLVVSEGERITAQSELLAKRAAKPDTPPLQPCQFCAHPFDHGTLGKYGCPNCCGDEEMRNYTGLQGE